MEPYGNDMFLSQEGYASIDFTLLDRPSTSVASAPESTAALLPDSSFPSFDFLEGSGVDSFGGVLHTAGEAHFGGQGRLEMSKDIDWRKEKTLHGNSTNMYMQAEGNQEPRLSSPHFHMPVSQVDFFPAKQSHSDNLQAQLSTSINKAADQVHDFFEQEHLSQQQTQLERRENWPVLNKNSWPVDSQNEESRFIHQSAHNSGSGNMEKDILSKANNVCDNATYDHSGNNDMVSTAVLSFTPTETLPDDGSHGSRMTLGARSPRGIPNNVISQPRNQPLNFDSVLNGSSAYHIRANQATSAGDGGTSERIQSNASSLAGSDTQQGHNGGQLLNHGRNNSETGENIEYRANYDFLGSQIHLKSQPEAGVQYRGTRVQRGLDEMQLWKQQYAYQQFQELRRQEQAQQLEQQTQQQQTQQLEQQVHQARQQLELQHKAKQHFQLQQQVRQIQLEQQARQQQLEQQARQQLVRQQQTQQFEQQVRQQQAQQFEQQMRQQQVQQLMPHTLQQQSQQLMLHAPQYQAQQLEHQARQLQAQRIEQQARQQLAQQLEQQARQQLEEQARQQLEQARQQRAQQLEQQARQQRAHLLEQQARQQQARQLDQQAPQQQAQQVEQQAKPQQAQQLEQHAHQLRAQQMEQIIRQKQLQQLLAGDNQNLGNQFSPSLYGSSMPDGSNFMRPTGLMSQMAIESHTPALLPGNSPHFNVENMNCMPNGSQSLPGFSHEILQDPTFTRKALSLMGAHLDPSVYGPAANIRDATGHALNSYSISEGTVQQLADASHKSVSATNHQVGKPVAHTIDLGAAVLGDHHTISSDPTSAKNDSKQGAPNNSLFGQSIPQNQGLSSLQQGTTISRISQLQDFQSKHQHRNWNEDLGQKDNFQDGSPQVLGSTAATSESGFYNFQQGVWQTLPVAQAGASSDGRNQSTSTGQYVLRGPYQTENPDFFSTLAVKPRGSWSALMQSAVAESPSGDGEPDDWSSLNLQKAETTSGDSLHFQSNAKEQGIWNEQVAEGHNSVNGRSFHLVNDESTQSVQVLPQSSPEGRGFSGSKLEGIQYSNQVKSQSGPSSEFFQEATGQGSKWQDHGLFQQIDKNSNPQSYSNFENRQTNSWIAHNIEQAPSEARLPSHHINFDGMQQDNSLQNQGSFKTESHKMPNLTTKDQSGWNKSESQETEQNSLSLNSNKGYRENKNENIRNLPREQLGSCVEKGEDQTYQTRYEGNKDTGVSFQCQDPKMNVYQNGQPLQQEHFSMGIFPRNTDEGNLETSAERCQQTPEMKYQLDGSNSVILDTSAKNRVIGNASIHGQGIIPQGWTSFPNSFSSPQRETNDKSQAQYGQNDSTVAGQMAGKGDPSPRSTKAGNDYSRNSPQREDDLQSLNIVNHRGYSRPSKMNVGLVDNSVNDTLRMMPGHMPQQIVGNVPIKYCPADGSLHDLSVRGMSHLDLIGQKNSEQTGFRQSNVARTISLNSTSPSGEDVLSTNLQKAGRGFFKDNSLCHTSTKSPAFERSTNIGSSNKLASLPSQNVLDLLTKSDHLKGSETSRGTVFSEQHVSAEQQQSSDLSLAHFGRHQSPGPSQGFGLRLAPPTQQQLLQMLHGRSLQSTSSQTARLSNEIQSLPSKEDSIQKSSPSHQILSSKVNEASVSGSQSLYLTASGKPLNSLQELSSAVPKENAVDLKDKPSCISASDIHPSKTQMQYMQRTNIIGQVASSPRSMFPHAVPERQSNLQGSMTFANQLQGSQDETIAGQSTPASNAGAQSMVPSAYAITDKESEMQGSLLLPSTRSFSQSSYPSDLLAQDGQNHKLMSLTSGLSGIRNSDQGLHESGSNSASNLPGTSGRSQSAALLRMLSNFKANCTNKQRIPTGVEKVFPNVFESFRPSIGGSNQSFLPRPDSQMKFGMLGRAPTSMSNQPYRQDTINSQQRTSTEEVPKQEHLFQQAAPERGESSGSPVAQNLMMAQPAGGPTLPLQSSALSSQLSMLHSQGQEQRKFSNHLNTPSIVSSLHPGICTYNQDEMKSTVGQDSQAFLHSSCPPTQQQSDSCSDGPVDSQASELSDAPHHQFSSANQFISLTAMQNDFEKRKRMKITDAGSSGIGPTLSAKSDDQITNPHTGMGQFKVASTARTVHEHGSLSLDNRMLPSSQGYRERSEATLSQGMTAMMQRRMQNQCHNPIMYQFSQSSSGADDRSHANPHSRLLHFGTNTNDKLLALQMQMAMYKRIDESARSAVLTSKQMTPGKNVECLFPGPGLATPINSHTNESALKEVESMAHLQIPTALSLPQMRGNDMHHYQYYLSKQNIAPPVTILSKKRKKVAPPLIPWHVEISQVGELPSTRDAEMAWAAATNRLLEKEEDEIDGHEDGAKSVDRVKRRLKLTSQLMQQLIPPLPSVVACGNASVEHENATYTLAKTALGDACKLVSTGRTDGGKDVESENLTFGQLQRHKKLKGKSLRRITEGFVDRAKNLDNEFLRFEASLSITELRSEMQALDSMAITKRLVTYHGISLPVDPAKNITEDRDSFSDSSLCTRNKYLQRYVTAVAMPRNLPEGVRCFSL